MSGRKRPAAEPLLPLRSAKHPRITPESEHSIAFRWAQLGKDVWVLTRETVTHICRRAMNPLQVPLPPSPSASASPSRSPLPARPLLHLQPLSDPSSSNLTSTTDALSPPSPTVSSQLDASQRRRSTRRTDSVSRKFVNREHIYIKSHKAQVRANHKKDREEMEKELFLLRKASSSGYNSDFRTFQTYLSYRARLQLLERREALSPSPSLTDLRSKRVRFATSRRHSFSEDVNSAFLERALEKARETLNGPKPPRPFVPSFDQLRLSDRAKDEEIERRIRGPKHDTLPSHLPPEDEAKVDAFLSKKGVVSRFNREQVTDRDISRLLPCQWLNDEIVNFYGQMILARSEGSKENPRVNGNGVGDKKPKRKPLNVHYFSTFFWSKIKSEGYERGRLAKWTKKIDIFQKDAILIPINHNNAHWTAAAINFRRKRIESYDSMGMERLSVYKLLRSYLDAEHRNKKKKPFDFNGWEDYTLEYTPQQENGYDCGVFTCQFLESLSRGEETFAFTQDDMAYLRRRMIWEIGHAKLRDKP